MSNMMKRSLDTKGEHVSPLGIGAAAGRTDRAYENLKVKILNWPDEERFKLMVYKATIATRGSDIDMDEVPDPVVVEDAFKGGLNQCLEWVTVAFEISGVSRGLTHELVRTRKASFAQQSMRHTDMGEPAMRMPEAIAASAKGRLDWLWAMEHARGVYTTLMELDIPYQDARTVLPIATETYIIASYPLGEFLNTYAYRACYMFYPEIVQLFRLMREALVEKSPWLAEHIAVSCEKTRPSVSTTNTAVTYEHQCTYQGWEQVEGHCPLTWAKEENRVWKSRKFDS